MNRAAEFWGDANWDVNFERTVGMYIKVGKNLECDLYIRKGVVDYVLERGGCVHGEGRFWDFND